MLRRLLLTVFTLLLGFAAWCADPVKQAKIKPPVKNDTTIVALRHFDKAALKEYSTKPEFRYDDTYVGETLWDRFWRWFWHFFRMSGVNASGFSTIATYLFIALGAAALIFVIFKLAGVDLFSAIKGKPMNAPLPYDESDENIYAIDFEPEIENAIAQQNYRLAVRLLYLRTLRQLSDANLIHWENTKTNSIYVNELIDTDQRLAFKLLTRQFEYVWYGEMIIDSDVFKKISVLFTNFKIKGA